LDSEEFVSRSKSSRLAGILEQSFDRNQGKFASHWRKGWDAKGI